jgi:hypothetical protein
MRRLLVVLVAVVGMALAMSASAAKDSKGKKDKDEGIQRTGIAAFDSVFSRVGEIDRRLVRSETQLRSAKTNLNQALGLKAGTPLSTGIAELRKRGEGKLQLAVDNQAVPKLQVTDAVPTNVQNAVDAVNGMTGNFTTTITELKGLSPEISKLVADSRKMPARLKDEFAKNSNGLLDQLFTLPKTSKALGHDLGITKSLPGRTASVTSRMTDILGTVQSEFGVRLPGQKPAKGAPKGAPAKKAPPKGGKK